MLELVGVSAGYGSVTAMRDVTLAVPAGSVVALLGPNGAGKTTLLRVLSGLLRPSAGEVRLDGVAVPPESPHTLVQRGVCHVPEGRGIFRSLSVRDNLGLFAGPGWKDAVGPAVDVFPKLGQRLGQTAGSLSGGEQQMLALARALLSDPRYVLLDEVSMGLAPVVIDEVYDVLRRLAGSGVSLLLVEQFAERALELADYAYVMAHGELAFAGEPTELGTGDLMGYYFGGSAEGPVTPGPRTRAGTPAAG